MATIKEDYISFETAKLLKEKGFGWDWSPFYSKQDKDEWEQNNSYAIANPNYDVTIPFDSETLNVVVPHVSLQMAMKWLRDMHNLYIELNWEKGNQLYSFQIWKPEKFQPEISSLDLWRIYKDNNYIGEWNYEQACEAAIKYCLENLI